MPCGAAGQCLARRCCWRLSFVEVVGGCEPRVRNRNRQHQRHYHDIPDVNGEDDHRMIVIGERALMAGR